MFDSKSITELRALATNAGALLSLSDTREILIQKIQNQGVTEMVDPVAAAMPIYPYYTDIPATDPKMATDGIAEMVDPVELIQYLQPYTMRGLIVDFPTPDTYRFRFRTREDSGTLRQYMRNIVQAADVLMK